MFDNLEDYKKEIIKDLMESSWRYSEEDAKELVEKDIEYVIKGFEKGESPEDVSIDIGYSCG